MVNRSIAYIAPSAIPSSAANGIHVFMQSNAFCKIGYPTTLFAGRSIKSSRMFSKMVSKFYGDAHKDLGFRTVFCKLGIANSLLIGLFAAYHVHNADQRQIVLTRNLYAAYILAVLYRRPILFETHQLEFGIRKHLQRNIIKRPWVKTIVISKKLRLILSEHVGVDLGSALVLHDAAPSDMQVISPARRRQNLVSRLPEASRKAEHICGYFGQLYKGRGIDILVEVAKMRPNCQFFIFGGTASHIDDFKRIAPSNMIFKGHVSNIFARQIMPMVDSLLMPYQERVSIGVGRHDTGQWMSPMKMFEYLGVGVPIISSDLPVLREILVDQENSLLVKHDDPHAWVKAIDILTNEPNRASQIGSRARSQFEMHHTWEHRAKTIMKLVDR